MKLKQIAAILAVSVGIAEPVVKFNKKLSQRILLGLAAICFLSAPIAQAATSQPAAWSYHGDSGPKYWGKLDPAYLLCASGKRQSPVNISNPLLTTQNILKIHYATAAAQAATDINTLLNIRSQKILYNDGHTLQFNFSQKAPEYIDINGKKYQLMQLHFHAPSENLINGQHFPIEIQMLNQSEDGDIAILSILLTEGNYNSALETLINELPNKKLALNIANKLTVDVAAFLPANLSYYHFTGSLTVPPCSENVKWFVLAEPLEASKLQIDRLKILLPADNARPVQTLNDREIMLFHQKSHTITSSN